jgi:alpha-galactosidase
VLSWAGQWATLFKRDSTNQLRIQGGQELTHFVLHPGEEVRSPMMVLMFWKGDPLSAQNQWRRWMITHNLPRPGGELPPVPQLAACSSHQFGEMINANRDNQFFFVDRYLEKGIKLHYWWMDAGWYLNTTGWPNTGTWEVDTQRFPGGLRVISDHAREKGVRTLVWFEPERVTPGTWLYEKHPEWLLGREGDQKLLNLGNPEACEWLTNHVDNLLNEQGIDLYRQDFNMDPLPYWRANDPEDRQGITEILHVMGYQAYWDELRRRHPNMLIDTCASGGRRNDLETLRRAVPLLRSDYIMEPVGNQGHTYALSFWFPFYGTGTSALSTYEIRSVLVPHFIACWDMRREDLEYDRLARLIHQWEEYAPNFMGDYYPLTPYSLSPSQWIAWQFHRPEEEKGMIQAFRRAESVYERARFPLKGVNPEKTYRIWNVDGGDPIEMKGKDLLEAGVPVEMPEPSSAVIVQYQAISG